jgi:hypothetical protein
MTPLHLYHSISEISVLLSFFGIGLHLGILNGVSEMKQFIYFGTFILIWLSSSLNVLFFTSLRYLIPVFKKGSNFPTAE